MKILLNKFNDMENVEIISLNGKRNFSLLVLETGRSGCQQTHLVSGEVILPASQTAIFYCVLMMEGVGELSGACFFIKSLIPHMHEDSTLMT